MNTGSRSACPVQHTEVEKTRWAPSLRGAVAFAIAAGLALGVGTALLFEFPHQFWWLTKVGVPWLAAAFVCGAIAANYFRGAVCGAVSLVVAVASYYPAMGMIFNDFYSPRCYGWIAAAIPGGLLFGAAGAGWRIGSQAARVATAALLAASFAGEAMFFVLYGWRGERVLGLFCLALFAALLPALLLRESSERWLAFFLAAGLTLVAVVAEGAVYVGLRYL